MKPLTQRFLRHWRIAILLSFLFTYVVLYDALAQAVGLAAGAIVVLPIALAGWWYGARAAVAVGVLAGATNVALGMAFDGVALDEGARMSAFATLAFGAVGVAIGSGRSARRRLLKVTSTDTLTHSEQRPIREGLLRECSCTYRLAHC